MIDPVLVAPFAYIASIVGTVLSGLCDHLHRVDDAEDIHDAVASALELLPTPMIGVYNNPLPLWRDSSLETNWGSWSANNIGGVKRLVERCIIACLP